MLRTGGPGSPESSVIHADSKLTPTIPEDEALEDAALPAELLEGLAEVSSAAGPDHHGGTQDGHAPAANGLGPAAAAAAATGALGEEAGRQASPPFGRAPRPRPGGRLASAATAAPDVLAHAAADRPRIPLLPTARTVDPATLHSAIL